MIPRALAPFLAFPPALRETGFAAAPEQAASFLAAVGLLGPRSMQDVRRAAHAVFGPAPERRQDFDEVFDAVFLGRAFLSPAEAEGDDMPRAFESDGLDTMPEPEEEEPSGQDATAQERLIARALTALDEDAILRAFARALPGAIPLRRSRRIRAGHGRLADPRRAFRELLRRDGELSRLPTRRRLARQRRLLLLVDVSGSMKAGTEGALRLAHALVQAADRAEVFTLGTRLTRVTRALRHRSREQALTLASGLVADWDGGTRLGEALSVFLAVPRFASFARGAAVVILSDGLERGGPEALVLAMRRLRGLAWRVIWLTPLAADPAYRPETGAMRAILPFIDELGDGSNPAAIARHLVGPGPLARAGAA
ncbi:MAG TPA: VWA domain-containing protein [Roseococcus sp.]|jgi:uncharacterized protein with von Willebrand factor type A (vWA) domain|nr:VWA domain-containing protein [Roseococcus sp.]